MRLSFVMRLLSLRRYVSSIYMYITQGPVLLHRYVYANKYKPLIDGVLSLEANLQYAHIRFTNGRKSTVSISDLAPARNLLPSGKAVDDSLQKDLDVSTSTNENNSDEIHAIDRND